MLKRVTIVALLATLLWISGAMATPTTTKPEAPREASYAEALAKGAATGKPVIVDFFAVW